MHLLTGDFYSSRDYPIRKFVVLSCIKEREISIRQNFSGFWKMAYRNENGFIRAVNTTTTAATTGTATGDNDRSVN